MIKIAVTGSQGQIARALTEVAVNDAVVIPIGRPTLDLERVDTVVPALAAVGPDVVVNAAAFTAVDLAETHQDVAMLVNAVGARAVAAAARELGAPVIQLSTDYVFDGSLERPYREDDPVSPIGAYGRSKLEGELAVARANDDHIILRTAWIYSPFGNNFLKTMLRLGKARDEVNVVSDQVGTPTYAPDIASCIIAIARQLVRRDGRTRPRGVFHLAGSGEATWADFAQAIFDEAAHRGRDAVRVNFIPTSAYPTAARRPANSRLDCSKLRSVFGLSLPDWRASTRHCVSRVLDHQSEAVR